MFPKDWRDFLKDYSFIDSEQVYTNGSELIQVFRVEQLIEHLLKEQKPQPEIVRCKDCRFRQSRVFRIIDGKECNLCEMVNGYKPADWFCADGKRRSK